MTSSHPPILAALDDKDFDAFLKAKRPAPPAVGQSGFEGYVTALVIGPKFIDPRRRIHLFADGNAMMAPANITECAAVQSTAATYSRLSAGFGDFPDIYRAWFVANDDGTWYGLENPAETLRSFVTLATIQLGIRRLARR